MHCCYVGSWKKNFHLLLNPPPTKQTHFFPTPGFQISFGCYLLTRSRMLRSTATLLRLSSKHPILTNQAAATFQLWFSGKNSNFPYNFRGSKLFSPAFVSIQLELFHLDMANVFAERSFWEVFWTCTVYFASMNVSVWRKYLICEPNSHYILALVK